MTKRGMNLDEALAIVLAYGRDFIRPGDPRMSVVLEAHDLVRSYADLTIERIVNGETARKEEDV